MINICSMHNCVYNSQLKGGRFCGVSKPSTVTARPLLNNQFVFGFFLAIGLLTITPGGNTRTKSIKILRAEFILE